MTTSGLPPRYANFASESPKVRQTERRPGNTRIGPTIKSYLASPRGVLCVAAVVV